MTNTELDLVYVLLHNVKFDLKFVYKDLIIYLKIIQIDLKGPRLYWM